MNRSASVEASCSGSGIKAIAVRTFGRALLFLVALFLSATMAPATALAQTMTISGTVSLPDGQVAPAGGIAFEIAAWDTEFIGYEPLPVEIAEGSTSVPYSISLNNSDWFLGIQCVNSCAGYSDQAFYTEAQTVFSGDQAAVLSAGSNYSGIDIELIVAYPLTGIVSLPTGFEAPGGGQQIVIFAATDAFRDIVVAVVDIPEGESDTEYDLKLPDDPAVAWTIQYRCFGCDGLVRDVYYGDQETTAFPDSSTRLNGGETYTGIDATFLAGSVISGQFSLPGGPASAFVEFRVTAQTTNHDGYEAIESPVFFETGEEVVNYSISVPDNGINQWEIRYDCFENCEDYVLSGYYSDTGETVTDVLNTTFLDAGTDYTGINLEAIPGVEFSGNIALPNGLVAAAGLQLGIAVVDKNQPANGFFNQVGYATVDFNGGETAIDYSVNVEMLVDADLVIQIFCNDFASPENACDGFIDTFYGGGFAQFDFELAQTLDADADLADLDFGLIASETISGIVSLPGIDLAPAGGVEVGISINEAEGTSTFSGYTSVVIAENEAFTSYLLKVPADLSPNSWRINVTCDSGCGNYENQVFYAGAESTVIVEQATLLANNESYTGIDIPLIAMSMISTFSCEQLVDDFSGQALDLANWNQPEFAGILRDGLVEIRQQLISQAQRFTFGSQRRFNLNLQTLPDAIGADVSLLSADLTDSATGVVFASARGTFYHTLDDVNAFDGNLGAVFAEVKIGDRGNGLEAWYSILEAEDAEFETAITHVEETLIPPGTIALDTVYPISLVYNSTTVEFTFEVNGVSMTATGPARGAAVSPANSLFRGFTAGAAPAENMDDDPIGVVATFDNVVADSVVFDDFASATLDPMKWEQVPGKRQIEGGKLVTELTSIGADTESVFSNPIAEKYAGASCLQADLQITSGSDVPLDTRIRNRLNGYWLNTKFNDSTGYNRADGQVYAHIALELVEDGTLQATVYAEEATNAEETASTQLVFHRFDTLPVLDQEYTAAIHMDEANSQILFRFADEVFALPILSPINPPNPDYNFTGFTTRVQSGPGLVNATVDNVYATSILQEPEVVVDDSICIPIVTGSGIAVICL